MSTGSVTVTCLQGATLSIMTSCIARLRALLEMIFIQASRSGFANRMISLIDIVSFNMPCYLKAAISVSGVGIYRCANREGLRDAMKNFSRGVPIQLQEEIKTNTFINMQYRVVGEQLVRMAVTEQVLPGGCAYHHHEWLLSSQVLAST